MYIVDIYVTNCTLVINRPFKYYSDEYILKYCRVKVTFNSSTNVGLVVACEKHSVSKESYEKELGFQLLPILEIIDKEPIINDELYALANMVSKTTFSPLISAINVLLPKFLKTTRKIAKNKKVTIINKSIGFKALNSRQQKFYNTLSNGLTLASARKLSASMTNTLINYHWLKIEEKEMLLEKEKFSLNENNFLILNDKQNIVYKNIIQSSKNNHYLYGITGSGKTEVYLHLARYYLKKQQQVLILVPEIALTPQMIERVKQRFKPVYFYHSALSAQEKYEQYMAIKNSVEAVVVGTRSAIFLPFSNLGLIVVDEEHDTSYKQDNTPAYDARKIALWRSSNFNAKVVFASATPSLEYFTYALNGYFILHKLNSRINETLPKITLINTKEEIKKGNMIISSYLADKIKICLNNNEQVIILLNRRGYAPIVRCDNCHVTLMCLDCDLALNYHADSKCLKCHQCGRNYKMPNSCLSCGNGYFSFYGYGTKKVVEVLKELFPKANINRLDFDNTQKKGSLERILNGLAKKEISILVGTQMLAKGLDYPNVTLVGLLNADAGLKREDYNASATTFSLLMQAAGRSGRGDKKGEVIIQAFNHNHYVLRAIIKQDYESFYWQEMSYRQKANYPPYMHFVALILSHRNETFVRQSCDYLWQQMSSLSCHLYRPLMLLKLSGQYRSRILLRVKSVKSITEQLNMIINNYLFSKCQAKIKVLIDPDNME